MSDISGIIDNLRRIIATDQLEVRAAGERFKAQLAPLTEEFTERIDRAVAELEKEEKRIIEFFPAPVVTTGKQGRWYLGASESGSPNWDAYRSHLESKGWGQISSSRSTGHLRRLQTNFYVQMAPWRIGSKALFWDMFRVERQQAWLRQLRRLPTAAIAW